MLVMNVRQSKLRKIRSRFFEECKKDLTNKQKCAAATVR